MKVTIGTTHVKIQMKLDGAEVKLSKSNEVKNELFQIFIIFSRFSGITSNKCNEMP